MSLSNEQQIGYWKHEFVNYNAAASHNVANIQHHKFNNIYFSTIITLSYLMQNTTISSKY